VSRVRGTHRDIVPGTPPSPDPGTAYRWADFYYDEVKSERERRTSFEQRGTAIISVSGVVIGLLWNGVRDASWNTPSTAVTVLLGLGLSALVLGALFGLLCAVPMNYQGLDGDGMFEILAEKWTDSDLDASVQIAALQATAMRRSLRLNLLKARFLRIATACMASGILLAATCIFIKIVS
jgi:hypothetical protein